MPAWLLPQIYTITIVGNYITFGSINLMWHLIFTRLTNSNPANPSVFWGSRGNSHKRRENFTALWRVRTQSDNGDRKLKLRTKLIEQTEEVSRLKMQHSQIKDTVTEQYNDLMEQSIFTWICCDEMISVVYRDLLNHFGGGDHEISILNPDADYNKIRF